MISIENLERFTEPFNHFVITDWADNYQELLYNLPPSTYYKKYNDIYPDRFIYSMQDSFWTEVKKGFESVYGPNIRVQMLRDKPNYSIGPHTDGQREISTILFYLTDKEYPAAGTCAYVPNDPSFRCDGKKHHEFDGFKKIKQAKYAPNMGFGFIRSDNSFHGVEPCDIERNLIQVSIWR